MTKVKVELSSKIVVFAFLLFGGAYLSFLIRDVLLMLFFAFILNSGLRPLVNKLQSKGVPRSLSILIIYLTFFAVVILIIVLVLGQLVSQLTELSNALPGFIRDTLNFVKENFPGAKDYFNNNDINQIVNDVQKALTGNGDISKLDTQGILKIFLDGINIVSTGSISVIETVLGALLSIFVVVIVSVYMLRREKDVYDGVLNIMPERYSVNLKRLLKKIEEGLGEWLVGQVIVMLIIGVLAYVIVMIPHVISPNLANYNLYKFAIIIALLAGSTEVIPQIGAFVTFVFTVLLAIISSPSVPIIIYIIVMFLALQQLEGIFITPTIMKRAVGVDPVFTILGIVAGFTLGGPFLALLAVPLMVAIRITVLDLSFEWKKHESGVKKEIKDEEKTKSLKFSLKEK